MSDYLSLNTRLAPNQWTEYREFVVLQHGSWFCPGCNLPKCHSWDTQAATSDPTSNTIVGNVAILRAALLVVLWSMLNFRQKLNFSGFSGFEIHRKQYVWISNYHTVLGLRLIARGSQSLVGNKQSRQCTQRRRSDASWVRNDRISVEIPPWRVLGPVLCPVEVSTSLRELSQCPQKASYSAFTKLLNGSLNKVRGCYIGTLVSTYHD